MAGGGGGQAMEVDEEGSEVRRESSEFWPGWGRTDPAPCSASPPWCSCGSRAVCQHAHQQRSCALWSPTPPTHPPHPTRTPRPAWTWRHGSCATASTWRCAASRASWNGARMPRPPWTRCGRRGLVVGVQGCGGLITCLKHRLTDVHRDGELGLGCCGKRPLAPPPSHSPRTRPASLRRWWTLPAPSSTCAPPSSATASPARSTASSGAPADLPGRPRCLGKAAGLAPAPPTLKPSFAAQEQRLAVLLGTSWLQEIHCRFVASRQSVSRPPASHPVSCPAPPQAGDPGAAQRLPAGLCIPGAVLHAHRLDRLPAGTPGAGSREPTTRDAVGVRQSSFVAQQCITVPTCLVLLFGGIS